MDFDTHERLSLRSTDHEAEKARWAAVLSPPPKRAIVQRRVAAFERFEGYMLAVAIGVMLAFSLLTWWLG